MTKRESLFLAIGQLEEVQLQKSELMVHSPSSMMEEAIMQNKNRNGRKVTSYVLVAALVISMLAVTAFAAIGNTLFESPKQMMAALFGIQNETGSSSWTVLDNAGNPYKEYHVDWEPVDESVSGQLEPAVKDIGQTITFAGYTLTVYENIFDTVSKCGFVTYSIENPNGISEYQVAANGQISFTNGELLATNQYGYNYIIEEASTNEKMCATFYYQIINPNAPELVMRLSPWAAKNPVTGVDVKNPGKTLKNGCSEECIVISSENENEIPLASFENDGIVITPYTIQVNKAEVTNGERVRELTVFFNNGEVYTVCDEYTLNYYFAVNDLEDEVTTFLMNRLVDVADIRYIVVNDIQIEN